MTVDYSKLRSVTARQLVTALQGDVFNCKGRKAATVTTAILMAAALHSLSTTPRTRSVPGTLRSIIEVQARWTEDDLIRLELID